MDNQHNNLSNTSQEIHFSLHDNIESVDNHEATPRIDARLDETTSSPQENTSSDEVGLRLAETSSSDFNTRIQLSNNQFLDTGEINHSIPDNIGEPFTNYFQFPITTNSEEIMQGLSISDDVMPPLQRDHPISGAASSSSTSDMDSSIARGEWWLNGIRFGIYADPNMASSSRSPMSIIQTHERLFSEAVARLRSSGVEVVRLQGNHDPEDPDLDNVYEEYDDEEYAEDETLDVENMSYEELSALGDQIGNVNIGLSEEAIMENLRQRTYQSMTQETPTPDNNQESIAICCICQEEFHDGEGLGELINCSHEFHIDCIKQWLMEKNNCPICKRPALNV